MSPRPVLPPSADLETRLAETERRLEDLERGRNLGASTQRGGAFSLAPEDGSPPYLYRFGEYVDGFGVAAYGVTAWDTDGNAIYATHENSRGEVFPGELLGWQDPTAISVTSGTFQTIAWANLALINHDVIAFSAGVSAPAGTIAEVLLTIEGGAESTNVVAVGGATGNVYCKWLHPFAIGWGSGGQNPGSVLAPTLLYQVRRLSGAGTVTAWKPRGLLLCNQKFRPDASDTTALTFS